jgi:cytochrome P450
MTERTATASDDERILQLYDVETHVAKMNDGVLVEDPYPAFAELRATGPVHRGSVAELLGVPQGRTFRPELPHYSAFSYQACDIALRDNLLFSSQYHAGPTTARFGRGILEMGGEEHRRYRALAQGTFVPRMRQWWIDRWVAGLVDKALSAFEDRGTAELNAELCARIPLFTITGSFGLSADDSWRFRELFGDPDRTLAPEHIAEAFTWATNCLKATIEDRRAHPRDDLITVLVQSELTEDGRRHLLTDDDILAFSRLLLTAGSGTTWRQMGIVFAALLSDQGALDAVRRDRSLVPAAVEEAVRWEPIDPILRRLVIRDTTLGGLDLPAGCVLELNLGSANRDPARWTDPDRFDIGRPARSHLGFATGPHVCLGMHLARAEMTVALNAALDRLPGLRLDGAHTAPRIVGLEHRGPTRIHVSFSPAVAHDETSGAPDHTRTTP